VCGINPPLAVLASYSPVEMDKGMEKKVPRKLPVRPTGDTVEIKGVHYNVLLRRIPEEGKKANVRNRRPTESNALDANTTKHKKAKSKKGVTPNHGATSTRAKKVNK
jgi:hypothetical protein